MKKLFFTVFATLLASLSLVAQTSLVQDHDYEGFDAVNITDNFVVKISTAQKYSVKTITDERISPYVSCYVKNGTLHVSVDRKSFPSDLKKQLKVKGAPAPVLEVEVYFPTIKSLELSGNAVLQVCDHIPTDSFTLVVNDKAKVNKISIEGESAEIILSRNAYASVESTTTKTLYVTTENSSQAIIKHIGNAVSLVSSGTSLQNVTSEVVTMNADFSGGSSIEVKGSASKLYAKGSGTARFTAEEVAADNAAIEQSGSSKCHVNVAGNILVNLSGGSMLTFMGKPTIEVDRIVNSTLIKHDDPRRK